ncbi:putative sugar transporter [Microstroma glucosiphilum]|uniref:Putative sugar transporter n=1 Tax=Pseudomicrostroma glucosiphilum TaxID=1684307 RepID=A0A316UFG3_9BASI|nr:putative sugar transporter [Pseudomicrostroma glucosiphilum]PWN21875.1 putative sugar transporter [Pseudomicrostroma glucosiphilum]
MGGLTHVDTRQTAVPGAHSERLWIFDSGLRRVNAWMFLSILSSFASGYDGSFFTGLLTVTKFFVDFAPENASKVGLLGTSGVLGLLVGPWISQYFCDKIGRPRTMIIASATMILGGGLSTIHIHNNPDGLQAMWIVARVITSIGSGIGLVAAPALITELAHPRHRAILVAFFWCGFYLGAIVAAAVTYGMNGWFSDWAWRLPSLLQIVPAAIQMPFLFFCPQSPRWLAARGREAEASQLLAKYHANGDESHPVVLHQMADIRDVITLDKASAEASMLDLFRGKAALRRVWVIVVLSVATQWVGNALLTYYLPTILATIGISSTLEQARFNIGIAAFNLVVSTFWGSQVERFGRRTLFLCSGVGMLICYTIITALSATYAKNPSNGGVGKGVIAFIFLFYFFYDMALTPLAIAYPAELLPYRLRSKGLALNTTLIAVALCFNIWVNPIAEAAIAWKYYIVFIAVIIMYLINVFLFFPETKGKSLEQLETIFEGRTIVFRNGTASVKPRDSEALHHTTSELEGNLDFDAKHSDDVKM